jgi:hypothetical protein
MILMLSQAHIFDWYVFILVTLHLNSLEKYINPFALYCVIILSTVNKSSSAVDTSAITCMPIVDTCKEVRLHRCSDRRMLGYGNLTHLRSPKRSSGPECGSQLR